MNVRESVTECDALGGGGCKGNGSHQVLSVILLSAKDSFSPKMFFKTVGLSKKTPTEIERVFKILDQDKSGYIEQDELQLSAELKKLFMDG